jgi:hypothetical protein
MATLEAALDAASSALLAGDVVSVIVSEDITGEYAASVCLGSAAPRLHRFTSLPELLRFLASGAVPGVRGDEQGWMPMSR